MCDICRKYRCPDGCPNNFVPTKKRKGDNSADRQWKFNVRTVVHADGESFENIIRKKQNNKEIRNIKRK